MDTKKLVVALSKNIEQQKFRHKINKQIKADKEKDILIKKYNINEHYISQGKQNKIFAIYAFLQEYSGLTKQSLEDILKQRPMLFRYYRYLLKKYPNFIYSIKAAGPYYYILQEAQDKKFSKLM